MDRCDFCPVSVLLLVPDCVVLAGFVAHVNRYSRIGHILSDVLMLESQNG